MKKNILLTSIAFFIFSAVAYAKAEVWIGAYSYDKMRPPVVFEIKINRSGENISGKITEPNTFGDNGFTKLFSTLKGTWTKSGKVEFIKKYDGTAGVNHSVEYFGQLNPKGDQVEGKWKIDKKEGGFSMSKQGK